MKYSQKDMLNILNTYNFKFKKKYGQNFIIDVNIINNIVNKSEIDNSTLVIEIGPGAGSLTYKLVNKAKFVLCYEIDKSVDKILKSNLSSYNNYKVIYDDFLKRNIQDDIKNYKYDKLYVVANLPYYITTPIITKIVENKIDVNKMIIMVQKEVGERFKATSGKDYNSLSIYLNYYFNISKIMDVSRNVFMPKPNVDSIVISLEKKVVKLNVKDEKLFFKLVRDSFRQKRKMLKNNLKMYNLEVINKVLHKNGYNLNNRAEQIPTNIFVEIANELYNSQKCA